MILLLLSPVGRAVLSALRSKLRVAAHMYKSRVKAMRTAHRDHLKVLDAEHKHRIASELEERVEAIFNGEFDGI